MTVEGFLFLLLVVSTLTGLATEAVKTFLSERGKPYSANTIAGIASIIISIAVGISYIAAGTCLNAQLAVFLIALVFLSWLSAMLGYDKVKQAITQLTSYSKEEN